jgi:hypothetical protein
MKAIEDWNEAVSTYKRGQMVRLMLGNAKWLEGLWSGDSIMVSTVSQSLRHELDKDDLITHNGKSGFNRFRLHHRNVTIPCRSYMMLRLDDSIISDEEE